jgi:hypothetical protein
MIGAIALAICVLCPLVDLCDQWDHVLQTGQDTEYPLMVLALCVGALFILVRLIATLSANPLVSSAGRKPESALSAQPLRFACAPLTVSPGSPPLSLRI